MDMHDYQKRTLDTAVYPAWHEVGYPILALCGEVGELANLYKKVLRGDYTIDDPKFRAAAESELGDILWYLARAAADLKFNLNEVAAFNLKKLALRKATGRIKTGVASPSFHSFFAPEKTDAVSQTQLPKPDPQVSPLTSQPRSSRRGSSSRSRS